MRSRRFVATSIGLVATLTAATGCSDSGSDSSAAPTGPDATDIPEVPSDDPAATTAPDSTEPDQPVEDESIAAATAANHFLDTYVDDSGRVIRTDQDDDTVSEGQAYALLLSLAMRDEARFAQIWEWTQTNLQRPNKLLAWRWLDGEIVDEAPASDADVLTAWALLLAADRWGNDEYQAAGEEIAAAILELETVEVDGGRVLLAGPWARHSTPSWINPGYFAPPAFSSLAELTGDDTWDDVAATSRDVTEQLTTGDGMLIPDWAQVDTDGTAIGRGAPDSGAPPVFSLDAARLYVFLASSCTDDDSALASPAWRFFAGEVPNGIGLSYDVNGGRLTDDQHALTWVAVAATAEAAGRGSPQRLLAHAERFNDRYPSYYGSAWVALGYVLLSTDWVVSC